MNTIRMELTARMNKVFREVFDDDTIEVSDGMTAKDIPEWDSLMYVVLVVAVEKEFGLKFNAAQVGKLKNVGEMLDIIEKTVPVKL